MAEFPRYISKQILQCIPAARLFRMRTPVFLPFYHTVSDKPVSHILNYPYRSQKEFENELDYILKFFIPVSLEDLVEKSYTSKKVFHLSFDDGLSECSKVIAPILLRKGIPATFFINTAFIDNRKLFHRHKASLMLRQLRQLPDAQAELLLKKHKLNTKNLLQVTYSLNHVLDEAAELMDLDFAEYLETQQPYLTTSEVKDLHKKGFSIGGHSHEHPEFWALKSKEQYAQIEKSMEWVNKHIQPNIKAFSFPYTDNRVTTKLLNKIIKENICDITFGTAGLKYDAVPSHFQRVPMERKVYTKEYESIRSEYSYFMIKAILGKNRLKRK